METCSHFKPYTIGILIYICTVNRNTCFITISSSSVSTVNKNTFMFMLLQKSRKSMVPWLVFIAPVCVYGSVLVALDYVVHVSLIHVIALHIPGFVANRDSGPA